MKFVFEDDFDFKSEIQKKNESETDVCLITGNIITDECKLKCNHKYNYDSLFTEVFNQKINPKFKNDIRLKDNEFKCPYCREIQRQLLPPRQKIFRVTTLDRDYEIDPNVVSTVEHLRVFKEGLCSLPSCNKKQVTFLERLKHDVCCFHIKLPKTQLIRDIKLHNYLLKHPECSLSDIPYFSLWEEIQKDELQAKEQAKAAAKLAKEQAKAEAKAAKEQAKVKTKATEVKNLIAK